MPFAVSSEAMEIEQFNKIRLIPGRPAASSFRVPILLEDEDFSYICGRYTKSGPDSDIADCALDSEERQSDSDSDSTVTESEQADFTLKKGCCEVEEESEDSDSQKEYESRHSQTIRQSSRDSLTVSGSSPGETSEAGGTRDENSKTADEGEPAGRICDKQTGPVLPGLNLPHSLEGHLSNSSKGKPKNVDGTESNTICQTPDIPRPSS